jgi:hypothetical protein
VEHANGSKSAPDERIQELRMLLAPPHAPITSPKGSKPAALDALHQEIRGWITYPPLTLKAL